MTETQQRSWWGRNWKWFVPVGCLTLGVICAGLIGAIVVLAGSVIKSSEPYKESLAKAQSNTSVQLFLGTPIHEDLLVGGKIDVEVVNGKETGHAELRIPITGPKGSATIHVIADKGGGNWSYGLMQVEMPGDKGPIDLLNPKQ